jgi:hypothetical protein
MRAILVTFCLVAGCAPAWAETLSAPAIKAGNTWVYRVTTENGSGGVRNESYTGGLESFKVD